MVERVRFGGRVIATVVDASGWLIAGQSLGSSGEQLIRNSLLCGILPDSAGDPRSVGKIGDELRRCEDRKV